MSAPLTTLPSSSARSLSGPDESHAQSSARSPLLRALLKDSDTQFQLLEFLVLNEIGMLARCSRVWSTWLNSDRAMCKRERELKPSQVPDLVRCKWVVRPIDTIVLTAEEEGKEDDGRGEIDIVPEERALSAALSALTHHLPWLIELHLTTRICEIPDVDLHLAGLSRLVRLTIVVPDSKQIVNASDRFLRAVLASIAVLRDLEMLSIEGFIDDERRMDFSQLPLLPKLDTFCCFTHSYEYECTYAQAEALSRCPSLTELDCGSWSPPRVWKTLVDSPDPQPESSIGMLVRRTTGLREDGTPFADLVSINWNGTSMTPGLWAHLVQLPTLTSLWFTDWRVGLSADQWMQMTLFKNLKDLSICSIDVEDHEEAGVGANLINTHEFLPALLLCNTISQLQLGDTLRIAAGHLESIARALTSLELLSLCGCWVESLQPLVFAPVLQSLMVARCKGDAGNAVEWRANFPALLTLTSLELEELAPTVSSEAEISALNAIVRAKLPLLTSFTETVVPQDEADDDNVNEWEEEEDGAP